MSAAGTISRRSSRWDDGECCRRVGENDDVFAKLRAKAGQQQKHKRNIPHKAINILRTVGILSNFRKT